MKIKFSFAVCLSVLFFTTTAFASGVLVDTKGQVSITMPDGGSAAAKTGVELPDGAKIAVGADSFASVMLMDGSIQEIDAGQNYTVGGQDKSVGRKTAIEGIALAVNEALSMGASPTVQAMVKMTRLGPNAPRPALIQMGNVLGPQGIYPSGTVIEISNKIIFRWDKESKIDFSNPVIIVEDESHNRLSTKKIKPSDSTASIKDIKFIAGKNYSWYFASDNNGKLLGRSRRFGFGILPEDEKKKIDEDSAKISAMNLSENAHRFLMAQLYFRAGMHDAMTKELLPLWEKEPSDMVKKLLFLGYARMGLSQEAAKYQ